MVLVDNNILSSLAKVGKLDFLKKVFKEVSTTLSIIEEINRDAVKRYKFVENINKIKFYRGGWLKVFTPTKKEVKETEDILSPSISFADAECIAVAKNRGKRLLTDDKKVGEMALQNNIEVWDLKLFIEACIKFKVLENKQSLDRLLEGLRKEDYYKFSNKDRKDLFNFFE